MTENKHGFMPKQEITIGGIGGIAFTIIQTTENWVKCIASECIGNSVFDAKNRNDFAASGIREFLNGEFLQKLIEAGVPEAMFEYFNVDLTADDGLKDYGGDRPLCVLKSEILKSYFDGDIKKHAEAVDMMKHIAAAWDIQPEEVFEKGE